MTNPFLNPLGIIKCVCYEASVGLNYFRTCAKIHSLILSPLYKLKNVSRKVISVQSSTSTANSLSRFLLSSVNMRIGSFILSFVLFFFLSFIRLSSKPLIKSLICTRFSKLRLSLEAFPQPNWFRIPWSFSAKKKKKKKVLYFLLNDNPLRLCIFFLINPFSSSRVILPEIQWHFLSL